jgi:hypothetical protein
MDVRIMKSRKDHFACQVKNPRLLPLKFPDGSVFPDADNPAPADRNGFGPGLGIIQGIDGGSCKQEFRRGGGLSARPAGLGKNKKD